MAANIYLLAFFVQFRSFQNNGDYLQLSIEENIARIANAVTITLYDSFSV